MFKKISGDFLLVLPMESANQKSPKIEKSSPKDL